MMTFVGMRHVALLGAVFAALIVAAPGRGQSTYTVAATATAEITTGLSIANTASLSFGDMFAPTAPATVTVTPLGLRSSTGTLILAGGTVSSASFNVAYQPGNRRFWILLPTTTTISSGANSMPVDTFQANIAAPYLPANCVSTAGVPPGPAGQCPNTPSTFTVGATLRVGANQPAGIYTGTFPVTVNRF